MPLPAPTLVTYTYNDGSLVYGLLESTAGWSRRPESVLIVDDGSEPPFAPPRSDIPVEILRLDHNRGPAGAKNAGLTRAEGEVLLSMDCDIRLEPDWLAKAFAILEQERIGLVGGVVVWDAGTDTVSRRLKQFYALESMSRSGRFLSGGVWLLKKSVWTEVDGFGDHAGRTHEDHVFCRRVQAAGYELGLVESPVVKQVRRIRRHVTAVQYTGYMAPAVLSVAEKRGPAAALAPMLEQVARRLFGNDEPGFLYLELLETTLLLLQLAEPKNSPFRKHFGPPRDIERALGRLLPDFPGTLRLLEHDLHRTGRAPNLSPRPGTAAPAAPSPPSPWDQVLNIFRPFIDNKRFTALEQTGLPKLLKEESQGEFDFHYMEKI